MANEYAVNHDDLAAVANAIREKGGTTDALAFPAGFVAAIGDIESGSRVSLDYVQCAIIDFYEDKDKITINDGVLYETRRRIVS